MKKLLLLDRDGTITENIARPGDYINDPDEIGIISGVYALLQQYRAEGWDLALLSNQGGIEKGFISMDRCIEGFKRTMSLSCGAISMAWFCPAAHGSGSDGLAIRVEDVGRGDYAWTRCQAFRVHGYRKPHPGMAFAAVDWFRLQEGDTVLYVGDRPEDRQMAENAGILFMDAAEWRDRSVLSAEAFSVL